MMVLVVVFQMRRLEAIVQHHLHVAAMPAILEPLHPQTNFISSTPSLLDPPSLAPCLTMPDLVICHDVRTRPLVGRSTLISSACAPLPCQTIPSMN